MESFNSIVKPSFAPPAIVFPIVWAILYVLMGISSYIVYNSTSNKKEIKNALTFYGIQLFFNSLWTIIFFRFKLYLVSFIWIFIIIFFLIIMIYKFYRIKPLSAYLQLPYLLWLFFASILNYAIYTLN